MTLPQPLAVRSTRYQDTHLSVDFEREAAYLDNAPLKLTHKAYSLLAFLVRHPGELVPRETLLMLVWGYSSDIRTRTLDVHVRRLRKSLGSYGTTYIETIFGIGYRFQPSRATSWLDAPAAKVTAMGAGAESKPQWRMAGSSSY